MKHYHRTSPYLEQLKFGFIIAAIGGLLMLANQCVGQTYNCAVSFVEGSLPFNTNTLILLSDSTFTITDSDTRNWHIKNRPFENTVYVTDGTAVHLVTILNKAGKAKSYSYTDVISIKMDKQFFSEAIHYYYCRRKP